MKKLLLLLVAFAILALSVSALRLDKAAVAKAAPKLVAKTTYESKWIAGKDGKMIEQKTPKKQLFQVIQKKTSMPDPTDPSKSITVEVPTEIPYVPNRKASGKVGQLKARYQALKKRENELKHQYAQAKSKLVDFPVLEDGAPAPPDAQEIEFRNELYGELEATQMPKAKNIQQHILDGARTFVEGAGATREKTWDMFEKMKKKMLVPSHGWSMEM
jgi:hypothetical protein